jgi:2,3-dihydroxybenzoate decarboxylase
LEATLIANLLDVHGHRLQQMNENGVDMMVLSLGSPGAQGFSNPAEAEKLANDRLEKQVMKNPTRFAGVVALSMHNPAQAAAELRRCMTEKEGFVGVMLSDFQSSGPDGNTMLFYDQPQYDVF